MHLNSVKYVMESAGRPGGYPEAFETNFKKKKYSMAVNTWFLIASLVMPGGPVWVLPSSPPVIVETPSPRARPLHGW